MERFVNQSVWDFDFRVILQYTRDVLDKREPRRSNGRLHFNHRG